MESRHRTAVEQNRTTVAPADRPGLPIFESVEAPAQGMGKVSIGTGGSHRPLMYQSGVEVLCIWRDKLGEVLHGAYNSPCTKP